MATKEHTDYVLLSIVAAVAIAAIIAMHASLGGGAEQDNDLTGQVSATLRLGSEGAWDYDGNGAYDSRDVQFLADAIALGKCPRALDCDLNNDGKITLTDLEIYNTRVREPDRPNVQVSATHDARPLDIPAYLA